MCAGCGAKFKAKQIIRPDTTPGKIMQNITGTGEQLVKSRRIDLHRRITTPDDVEIDVWVIKARASAGANPRGTVVVLHGLTETKAAWPYFGTAQVLGRKGYDVILLDLRAHGRSGGKYVTYGAKEKHDVKAVVDALLGDATVHEPIYAFGATLGAATAIQYAAIDSRCKAVFALTPYQDARKIARRKLALSSDEEFADALALAARTAKFDPDEASSVKAAAKLTIPLLLVHGMIDLSVPKEHSEAILQAAGGPKKLILISPPEYMGMVTIMEDWIAEKIDTLARIGLTAVE